MKSSAARPARRVRRLAERFASLQSPGTPQFSRLNHNASVNGHVPAT